MSPEIKNGNVIEISSPGTLCICVDKSSENSYAYRLYHCYSKEPAEGTELGALLVGADSKLNGTSFPQPSTESRTFSKKRTNNNLTTPKERQTAMAEKTTIPKNGEKGTFLVHVQYRQNATWQGKVVWTDKNKTCCFRSALELLKLIDSALDEDEAENK